MDSPWRRLARLGIAVFVCYLVIAAASAAVLLQTAFHSVPVQAPVENAK